LDRVACRKVGPLSTLVGAAIFHAVQIASTDLYYRATHDALTSLANRALFYGSLRQQLVWAERCHGSVVRYGEARFSADCAPDESPRNVRRSHSGATSMSVKHLILLFATAVVTHAGRASDARLPGTIRRPVSASETHGGVSGDRTTPSSCRYTEKSLPVGVGSDTGKNPTRQLVRIGPDKIRIGHAGKEKVDCDLD
jgi:hypothetical protein